MAKSRVVNTKFWSDDYISHLDPVEKLLFLYFLTNPFTDISGVYEIPLKNIAIDTGIDKEMVEKVLKRFEKHGKIWYRKGWIAIKNFAKHQNTNNPQIAKGIEIGLNKAPDFIKEKLINISKKDMTHISVIDESSHLNPNLNSNSNLNSNFNSNPNLVAEHSSADIVSLINLFKEINPDYSRWYSNTTQRAACRWLLDHFPREDLEKKISLLPKINSLPYAPITTTPYQLRTNMSRIMAFLEQEKNKKKLQGKAIIE